MASASPYPSQPQPPSPPLDLSYSAASSIYNSHSSSNPTPSLSINLNLNLEHLEPLVPKPRPGTAGYSAAPRISNHRNHHLPYVQEARAGQPGRRMSAGNGNGNSNSSNGTQPVVIIEQKKSYGIGGAGNIRRPSEIIYPPRLNADGTRRSSVWSNISVSPGSSPDGKRATLMNLFARKGTVGGGVGGGYTEVDEGEG